MAKEVIPMFYLEQGSTNIIIIKGANFYEKSNMCYINDFDFSANVGDCVCGHGIIAGR